MEMRRVSAILMLCTHALALRQIHQPANVTASTNGAKMLRASKTAGTKYTNATSAELAKFDSEFQRGESLAHQALLASKTNISLKSTLGAPLATYAKIDEKGSFQGFYNAHASGRGVWKWGNSLDAYQRHFGGLSGSKINVAEVGVQSGGSILMWQSVLGADCHVYGLDINKNCVKFQNEQTTITIGDQASPEMWKNFFANVAPKLDILVDDGGHEPHQMLTTLAEVFYRLQPGGFIAIEDIHGQHYVQSFFTAAGNYLGYKASEEGGKELASVHVYPFLLIAHKTGKAEGIPASEVVFSDNRAEVSDFIPMWAEIPKHAGGAVELKNKAWGSFLTGPGLQNFFAHFGGLHDFDYYAEPAGCEHTPAPVCSTIVRNTPTQALVSGIHVYEDRLVVEVPVTPPVISAVRKGTEWIPYDGP